MVSDPREDALTHASNNPCSISQAFIDTELDILSPQEQGASTQQDGRRLRGDSGSGACAREAGGLAGGVNTRRWGWTCRTGLRPAGGTRLC